MLAEEERPIELTQLRRLEFASLAEATTLVLLVCVAVPLKHIAGYPIGVRIMGPVHGLAFLAYTWMAVQTVAGGDWTPTEKVRLFVGAFVPFGGFFNLPFLARKVAQLQ